MGDIFYNDKYTALFQQKDYNIFWKFVVVSLDLGRLESTPFSVENKTYYIMKKKIPNN